jgi:hypothetical protein
MYQNIVLNKETDKETNKYNIYLIKKKTLLLLACPDIKKSTTNFLISG